MNGCRSVSSNGKMTWNSRLKSKIRITSYFFETKVLHINAPYLHFIADKYLIEFGSSPNDFSITLVKSSRTYNIEGFVILMHPHCKMRLVLAFNDYPLLLLFFTFLLLLLLVCDFTADACLNSSNVKLL